jgi:hypothetical protein
VNTLPFLGPNYIPWSQLGDTLVGGFRCMIGINTVVTNCITGKLSTRKLEPLDHTNHSCWFIVALLRIGDGGVIGGALVADPTSLPVCDVCDGAWIPMVIYLAFNISQSVFVVLVIKHGSASLMYLISTLRLPMVQLAFTMAWINSPPDVFHWASLLGLFIVLGIFLVKFCINITFIVLIWNANIAGLVTYRWPRKTHRRRQVRSTSLHVGV